MEQERKTMYLKKRNVVSHNFEVDHPERHLVAQLNFGSRLPNYLSHLPPDSRLAPKSEQTSKLPDAEPSITDMCINSRPDEILILVFSEHL